MLRSLLALAFLLSAAAEAPAQTTFAAIPTPGPLAGFTHGYTERLMFGDLDGDGDVDVVLAEGGDFGNQRNRVWINLGGLQGGTIGTFSDQSNTRWPNVSDTSRDVELVDIDDDGDLDAYISNTSTQTPQSNRWIVNMGGAQGGTPGFFQDQTSARWMGLAQGPGPGHPYASSINPLALVGLNPPGGFRDWSCECAFGDVDNDGDMDLLHASYGPGFNGQVPTRIFLNDGAGFFSELNPSGFQLPGDSIANGHPALWAEGTQQANTTNTTGQFADIATHQLAAMFADLDNDLDLDVFLGSRNTQPRAFFNRLDATGTPIFRDMTAYVYSVPAANVGNYEQNLADLDNDGDLDAYLLDYGASFADFLAFNDGTGRLVNFQMLAASTGSDNEADFLDADNDGDLDIVVAPFNLTERIYVNAFVPTGSAIFSVLPGFPTVPGIALDVDVADVDNDGDTDIGFAMDQDSPERFYRNLLVDQGGPVDATAPRLRRLEAAPDRSAGSAPTVVRTQLYDNSALYLAGRDVTRLVVAVDGCPMPDVPMKYSGGQIFRGTIPGAYIGTVTYFARSTDPYGNTGQSSTAVGGQEVLSYLATGTKNATAYGPGTPGTFGLVPALGANGPAAAGNAAYGVCVSNGLPGSAGWIVFSLAPVDPPLAIGVAVSVSPGAIFFVPPVTLDAQGRGAIILPIPATVAAGGTVYAQFVGIDAAAPIGLSSSNGLAVTTTPPLP